MRKTDFLNGSINIINGFKCVKMKLDFIKQHPDYFEQSGLLTFCGCQGSGKTISLVNYVQQLCDWYPKVVVVSNVVFFNLPKHIKVIYYKNLNELVNLFDQVHNGYCGVIYVVDEIQTLFNNLLKRGSNVATLETISQQRKQRKHIIGTAQVFNRLDKVFREQMENVISCSNFFGILQFNRTIDTINTVITDDQQNIKYKKFHLWFHTPQLYDSYDTSAVISAFKQEFVNSELSEEAYQVFRKMLGGANLNGSDNNN